jgi:hypothetical protein
MGTRSVRLRSTQEMTSTARGGRIDTETDYAHDDHCHEVWPCDFDPLTKSRSSSHIHDYRASLLVMVRRRCCRHACKCRTGLTAAEKVHDFNLDSQN